VHVAKRQTLTSWLNSANAPQAMSPVFNHQSVCFKAVICRLGGNVHLQPYAKRSYRSITLHTGMVVVVVVVEEEVMVVVMQL